MSVKTNVHANLGTTTKTRTTTTTTTSFLRRLGQIHFDWRQNKLKSCLRCKTRNRHQIGSLYQRRKVVCSCGKEARPTTGIEQRVATRQSKLFVAAIWMQIANPTSSIQQKTSPRERRFGMTFEQQKRGRYNAWKFWLGAAKPVMAQVLTQRHRMTGCHF